MADRQRYRRPDDPASLGEDISELFRSVRRLSGRNDSGRVGNTPIVVEAVPMSGNVYRVQIRNQVTGNIVVLGEV